MTATTTATASGAATLPGSAARPFRFGMLCRHAGGDGAAWRERVRQAEDLGFDALLVSDHLDDQSAPIPALGAAAMVSSGLRLGTLVLSNPFRPAAVVAKDAETLQRLSDGRFELGLGTGWSDHDLGQLDGQPVRRDRVADLARTIDRIRPTLAGAGGLRRIPLHVGGGGRRVLSLAAREADIVGFNVRLPSGRFDGHSVASMTAAATDEKLGWVTEAAGERFGSLELSTILFFGLVVERRGASEEAARLYGLSDEEGRGSPHLLVGPKGDVVERTYRFRERFGISFLVVSELDATRFAPAIEELRHR